MITLKLSFRIFGVFAEKQAAYKKSSVAPSLASVVREGSFALASANGCLSFDST